MNYVSKLTLSMTVPTVMVAGAGGTVFFGARWLAGLAAHASATEVAAYLSLGASAIGALTLLCVGTCVGFTIWIRRAAAIELGGDPALARAVLADIAGGDLRAELPQAPEGSLLHSIACLAHTLRGAIGSIHQSTQSIELATTEIAAGSQDLSLRTERTSSSLQQAESSMQHLSDTIGTSSEAAVQASQLAGSASEVAQRGGTVVAEVVSTMDAIQASSRRIADIIGVIDGIAFQTNILALNAAVEAARAGEQGRGFAVVAGEVRLLAQRSAEAAREIKTLIGNSVDKVEAGSRLVQSAGSTMNDIVASVQRVSDIVREISVASREQRDGIGQVNATVDQLDQMTHQNAALVEQSAAAAASLKEQAARLNRVVGTFRLNPQAAAG